MFIKILVFLVLCLSLISPPKIYSEDATDLQNKINEYIKKLNDLGTAKNTLANQIKIINSQVDLTTLKITQTENSIKTLESEIATLTVKINDLDVDLNKLSTLYINQINQNYKLQKRIPQISIFTASNFNSFLQQYKYASVIQKNSQNTLINMETTRTNFDIQKATKAQKQQELETLQKTLAGQKIALDKQKKSKSNLLEVTKNDETKYQQLLNEAQQQLNALRSFSRSTGEDSCLTSSPGSGNDGNFYSQRDPRWCRQIIGLSTDSQDTIGNVGCYISSVSMVFKKLGIDINPSTFAANPSNFVLMSAWMKNVTPPSGYRYDSVKYNTNTIDNELKNGRFVIAQISMKNISGMHFIVLISGSNGNYKMHDPWYGPDLDFSSHYTPSSVISLRLITK